MFESVDWKISKNLISYDFAISEMEKRVLEIKQNSAKELVWLLEHQPIYTKNKFRSINPEFLVLVGVCTHLGCSPLYRPNAKSAELGLDWNGGFFCPCHGSKFDLSGRVHKAMPAPSNLEVPPYYFASDNKIIVGKNGDKS